jgi:hypothetical protein
VRRPVLQDEDRQPADGGVRVARGEPVQQRPVGVDVARVVAREQLEREQGGTATRRALVVEAPPEQLELLPVAELPDRAVRERALAEVLTPRRAFDLVLPLRPQLGELALGALLGQRGRLRRGCRELRQR